LTRAINRLVVCGADGERKRPDGCWWDLVFGALHPVSEELTDHDGHKLWLYRKAAAPPGTAPPGAAPTSADPIPAAPAERPLWLDRQATVDRPAAMPLSPSKAHDESAVRRTSHATPGRLARLERAKAMARGALIHRLLQALPDISPEARAEAARRHLGRTAQGFTAEERQCILDQVGRVLDDRRFCALFSSESKAEVPIVGRVRVAHQTGELVVSGQVDRLAVTGETVLIADYKSNRPAPSGIADVPPAYIRQLALYCAVLAQLYPEKTIRAALLWTDVPDLMEVPAAALERELALVTCA
jgi:ATP-dependent helicase/nuclease subunit A